MSFKENLRYYREKAGLSSVEFAEKLNLRYNTYLNYENKGTEPKYDILCKIASLLHVSTDKLLGFDHEPSSWLETEFSPSIDGLPITVDATGGDIDNVCYNGTTWAIQMNEIHDLYDRASREVAGAKRRETLYKYLLEYFLAHPEAKSYGGV